MVRQPEDAAELTQEVMLRALRHLGGYDPARPFSTWIYAIARNACIDHLRKHRARPGLDREVPDRSAGPEDRAAAAERARHLQAALDELPPLYREVLLLYHYEHLKYREIAEVLDIPIGTVMNRIFRARRKLRALYEARLEAR